MKTHGCEYANFNFLKKAYYSLLFFINELINIRKKPDQTRALLAKCIKKLIDIDITRKENINTILTPY